MFELMITMLERLGIIVTVAFVITRFKFFRRMIGQEDIGRKQQFSAILFFGFFGIIGTYSGLAFSTDSLQFNRWAQGLNPDEAIANSRVIGIIIAGLLGGYKVGIGAGIIAGAHRYTLGGFTDLACGLSAVVAGIVSAAFHKKNKKNISLSSAFVIGALAEAIQMLIILLVADPYERSIALVKVIGVPMILANGIGSALFLLIIKNVIHEEEKAGSLQAQKALRLAELTITHLRKGLNVESAKAVCSILYKEVGASAISMTDEEKILTHIGLGDDHHQANSPLQTAITKRVIKEGQLLIANQTDIHCAKPDCPLHAVVVAPLKRRGETIGTLKFYFQNEKDISNLVIQLIKGLSSLLSHQLEIAEVEKANELAKEAEIKALQAQISPHFLFNSLNIIVSLIRINPVKARNLLIALSHFFRQNLTATTKKWTTLEVELNHVRAYLSIEEARFIDKLEVLYDIDERALTQQIPPLTLQPIVENAIKHGIKDKEKNCHIKISIKRKQGATLVSVVDNGNGFEPNRINDAGKIILANSESGTGIGLYNVNRRLILMLGDTAAINIDSKVGEGTTVYFIL